MKLKFLVILMSVWASASWATSGFDDDLDTRGLPAGAGVGAGAGAGAAAEPADDDLGSIEEMLTARVILENQRDTIEQMAMNPIFSGLSMSVRDAISILGDIREQPFPDFLATLQGCVETGTNQDMTLGDLLEEKRKRLSSAKDTLRTATTDASLRVPTRPARAPASAAFSSTDEFSSAEEERLFKADYRLNPGYAESLARYLNRANLLRFFNAQALLQIEYGVDFIENDLRLRVILGVADKEYKVDKGYLWVTLIETIAEMFFDGKIEDSDEGINHFLHMLKYNDTWGIGKAISGHNRFYDTRKIVEWYHMTPEERAADDLHNFLSGMSVGPK